MRMTIINQPIYNRGDQAAFKALISLLQTRPDLDITVLFCRREERDVEDFVHGTDGVKSVCFPKLHRHKKFFRRIGDLRSQVAVLHERVTSPEARHLLEKTRAGADAFLAAGNAVLASYDRDVRSGAGERAHHGSDPGLHP